MALYQSIIRLLHLKQAKNEGTRRMMMHLLIINMNIIRCIINRTSIININITRCINRITIISNIIRCIINCTSIINTNIIRCINRILPNTLLQFLPSNGNRNKNKFILRLKITTSAVPLLLLLNG
jgi:hypothetical protein